MKIKLFKIINFVLVKSSIYIQILSVFSVAAIYQIVKRYLFPDISLETSNIIMVVVTTVLGTSLVYFYKMYILELERSKNLDEELLQKEFVLSKLIDDSPIPMVVIHKDLKIEHLNKKFIDVIGYTLEELPTVHEWWNLAYHHNDKKDTIRKVWLQKFEEAVSKKSEMEVKESRILCKDGTFRDIIFRMSLMHKKNLLILQDVTNIRKIEVEMQELSNDLKVIFDSVPASICYKDTENNFIKVNKATSELTGFAIHEIEGHNASQIFPNEADHSYQDDLEITSTGESKLGIIESITSKDGIVKWLETDKLPIKNSNGIITGILVFSNDISDKKKLDEEKIKIENQLRHTQKMEAIGVMAGGIAHDFNNILSVILGYSEIALQRIDSESSEFKDINQVLKATYRARELVKRILIFSRKEQEHDVLPTLVSPIVKEVLKLMRAAMPTTIEIKCQIQNEDVKILADPTQIHQVLVNLCTNATCAMEEGGTLSIDVSDTYLDSDFLALYPEIKEGSYAKISISDTGHGISPSIVDRIFEPYFTTKDADKGSGLGLSIVHGIIRYHKGIIKVYSEVGKGAIFTIYIPKIEAEECIEEKKETVIPKGTEHILIIDDEQSLLEMAVRMLEKLGYKVTSFTDSIEALNAYKKEPKKFNLIITDYTMPNMTGLNLNEEVKAIDPFMPVIVCTGYSSRISSESIIDYNIQAVLMKPISTRELGVTVRKVLDLY